MRRNILSMAALAVAAAFTLTSCLSDGDDTIVLEDGNTTGIPGDDQAGPNPTIDNQTTTIPNITTTLEGDGSTAIARIDMTGVQEGGGYDWLRLVGTGQGGQNVWVEVDGKPKGIAVVNNADNEGSQTMPKIDLVFCVDNSGSMSEEADAIARDIVNWANLLQNSSLDIRFGCVGYSMWGEISGAVVAPGKIKVESERKTVQHLEGGIVDAILVREGQEVAEGQVLVELESVQVDASENMLQKQLVAQWAAHSRALAEKSFKDDLVWPDGLVELAHVVNSTDVLDNEQKIFLARREALRGQLSLLETQIAQLQAQVSGFEDQVRAETTIIGTLNEELRAKRQLYKERYLEKSQILELERNLASHMGERGRLRQAIADAGWTVKDTPQGQRLTPSA